MKKILLSIITLIILFILTAQIDDDLTDEAKVLIGKTESTNQSHAYLYLMGFYANENDSPEEIGKILLEEYRMSEPDKSYEVIGYQKAKMIALPEGELFCKIWEDGCLENLFNPELHNDNLNKKHSTLVARLDRFHNFKEYATLTKPSITEPTPPFHFITVAERIKVLNAIKAHMDGKPEKAIADLKNQLSKLRYSLGLQDTLIGKMVFLMTLSEIVDVLSIISHESQIKVEAIEGLSQNEKTFGLVSTREFGMSYNMFKELDRHPWFFDNYGDFPGWITRMVYKPNMTINATAPTYTQLERVSLLSPAQFAKAIEDGSDVKVSSSIVRNYVGSVLIDLLSPRYDEYVSGFMDFDAKLVLFNNMHEGFDTAINPYYEDEGPEVFPNKVCFRGPLEDKKFLRCLRINNYKHVNKKGGIEV